MELENIRTFLTVADLGNYTKAAEELGYAQSTITAQIRQLEKELNYPLFERIGRKNYLTAGGQEFLPHAAQLVQALEKAKAVGQDPKDAEGVLRIGVLESLLFAGVLGILLQYRAEYPKIDVVIKIGQAADLMEMLRQNQLDIAYVSYSCNSDANLACAYRRKEELAFMAAANHPLAGRKKVEIEEVLSYPFVVTERSGRCYGRLLELTAEHKLTLRFSVMVDNLAAIAQLLADGQSVTFLPKYAMEKNIAAGELTELNVNTPPEGYYSQILYHRNKYLAPYILRFIQHIRTIRPERE